MRAALLVVLLVTSAGAEPVSGLDDPAFRAPFDRALQNDDPTALSELHAAAEAGNQAAILALPVVSTWLQTSLPFAERKKLARVNGIPMAEAFAAANPVAALWSMGETGGEADALLDRAFALYAAGEPDKATLLFMTWVNQTGGYRPQAADFHDHPTPDWAMGVVLWGRLNDTVFATPEETNALIVERLMADDPAVWIALAGFAGLHRTDALPADTSRLATIFKAAGVPQDQAARRMQAARPVLLAMHRVEPVLDAETARAAVATFRDEPEFQPLLTLCHITCPATEEQCTTAFIAAFGHPFGRASMAQPLVSLISTKDFFATPRGQLILLRSAAGQLGDDPASSVALAAAREIDACLADAVLSALP